MASTQQSSRPEPAARRFALPQGSEGTLLLVAIGALLGLIVWGVGLYLMARWWGMFAGGIEEWRKNWTWIGLAIVTQLAGLGIMFASLQLSRGEERANPLFRRLLYGYNAVLTGFLLLEVLVVVNLLVTLPFWPFKPLNNTYDWTESTIYTLHPDTKKLLESLDKPVKVVVLLPSGEDFLQREIHTLMGNVRNVTKKVEVQYLSPDLDPTSVLKLEQDYQIPERVGVLVTYGPEGQEAYEFIKADELYDVKSARPGSDEKPKVDFKGESALYSKLAFLSEGKSKPILYFTQGNGEPDLNNFQADREDRGLGRLKDRLTRANYEVKELKIGLDTKEVPDDASVVVIARPTTRLPENAVEAMRTYMNPTAEGKKKGKLVVLLDVVKDANGMMTRTVEDFLAEFSVQAGDERIVCLRSQNPLVIPVTADPRTDNPIVSKFQDGMIPMQEVRPVRGAGRAPMGGKGYQTEDLLVADPRFFIWAEANLNADTAQLVAALKKPDRLKELQAKISQTAIPVAVAVTEPGQPNKDDPHAMMRGGPQLPRLVVFGDASWVSNRQLDDDVSGKVYFDLFVSSVSWLRDRPALGGGIDPKERKAFMIKSKDKDELFWRFMWLPMLLLTVAILGLGAGVWVVRRR